MKNLQGLLEHVYSFFKTHTEFENLRKKLIKETEEKERLLNKFEEMHTENKNMKEKVSKIYYIIFFTEFFFLNPLL
jgi:predicted nuclease with TOPRIM domain